MSKKKKFDLTALVHQGYIKDGETISFVSDPSKNCRIHKMPNGEYKLIKGDGKTIITAHAYALECLGTEPPDHASKWLRAAGGKTLYELWHADDAEAA